MNGHRRPPSGRVPLVSVIVRTRDRLKLLAECLRSLEAQEIKDLEIIVINDGGEDVSEVVAPFEETLRLVSRRLDPPRGRCGAANCGLELAHGRWLAFADDDDLWLPGGIKYLLEAAGDQEGVFYGVVEAVFYPGEVSDEDVGHEARPFHNFGRSFSMEALLFENFIPIIGCLIPTQKLREIGGIDESLEVFEDWDLFLRLALELPFHFVEKKVAEYRVFGSAFITGAGGDELQISGRTQIYRKHWSLLNPAILSRMQHYAKSELIPLAVEGEVLSWEKRVENLKSGLDNALGAVDELRGWLAERDESIKRLWEEHQELEEKRSVAEGRVAGLENELESEPSRTALISVVIVNFNGLSHLQKCLPSLLKTEKVRYEIIVVDNGSRDASMEWLRKEYPEIRIVEIGANVGFGEGNRQGVLASRGQWIALLNNDTVVEPGWLFELLRVSLADPSIAASCSTLRLMQHPEILNGVGGGMSKLGYGYDRRYACPVETAGLDVPVEEVFFPTAAAMLISRRDFDDYGFDRRIFMYHEDVDLGWRIWLYGRRVVVCRDSIVYHHFGGTTHSAQGLRWRERMGSRHNLRSILKHAEILTMMKAFKGLFRLWMRMGAYRHILHVVAWNLYRLPSTLKERRRMQRIRKIRDAELVRRGFISPSPYPAPSPEIPLRDRGFVASEAVISRFLRPADYSARGRLGFGWYEAHPIEDAMVRPFCGHCRSWLRVGAAERGTLVLRLHVPKDAAGDGHALLRVNSKEIREKLSGDLWQELRLDSVDADADGVLEVDLITPAFRPHQLYGNWDFRRLGGAVRDLRFIPEGSLKNNFPVYAPRCATDLARAIEQNRRRSRHYVEDFAIEAGSKLSCRWDAKTRSDFGASPEEKVERIRYSGLSVLITTFRRWNVLKMTLDAIARQSFEDLQIVVMDDGSGDETWEMLQEYRDQHPELRLKIATQENTGQGPARNHALELAEEELVLFLGDDIIPEEGFLRAHLDRQNQSEDATAVVGFTDWYRHGLCVTPFMDFVNREGHQFGYRHMKSGKEQPFTCFYTSNISLPREILGSMPFDPSFSSYGWEDVELGYRLNLRGCRIVYEEKACAGHYHDTTVQSFYRRMAQVGETHHKLLDIHPELLRHPQMPLEHPPSWYRWAEGLTPFLASIAGFLDRRRLPLPRKFFHHLMMIPFYQAQRKQREDS